MTPGEAPVVIVPYDPGWPGRFKEEEKELRQTLAGARLSVDALKE
jgi:GrpB-like predicted nucleotidyltransferase (UPF0157 family)